MITREEAESWTGRAVRGRDGSNLGRLKHVYLARADDHPTWGVVGGRVLGRDRMVPLAGAAADRDVVRVPVDREHVRSAPGLEAGTDLDPTTESRLEQHYAGRGALSRTRDREQAAYGGVSFAAALFGWIVAVGSAVILAGIGGAVATAVGAALDLGRQQARQAAEPVGVGGAIALLVIGVLAYLAGGYVAGRMARFDGARNGFAAWLFGVLVTLLVAGVAVVAGTRYDVLRQLSLPGIPIDTETVTVAGLIALGAMLLGTLLAAVAGGKLGERFHHKVDRAGFDT